MNNGILTSGYAPPLLPRPLLGSPTPVRLPRGAALDPSAASYLAAVEAADGQSIEAGVAAAINLFVVGCKNDGIWNAIKASCILMGARTLAGALVPLTGPAPTNFNFVTGDYDRKAGLIGNASTKYLGSGFSTTSGMLNNLHMLVGASSINSGSATQQSLIGISNPTELYFAGQSSATSYVMRANDGTGGVNLGTNAAGCYGWSRSSPTSKTRIYAGTVDTTADASTSIPVNVVSIFARTGGSTIGGHRLHFYSIGDGLSLALLNARVVALRNAYAAVIA